MSLELVHVAIGAALCFAFVNGFHDGGNVVATIIGSRSMPPYRALFLATLAEFVGPLLIGTAVAGAILSILNPDVLKTLNQTSLCLIVISSVFGAISWKLPTWFLGLPSSSSHAIISGLAGSALVAAGRGAINTTTLFSHVVAPMLISPIAGALCGYLCFSFTRLITRGCDRSIGRFFVSVQKPVMLILAGAHGSNDAQKAMGLIAAALISHGGQDGTLYLLPTWVVLSCAAALALGVASGGLRIVKSVGYDIFRMEPVHSFTSLFSSTSVVLGASILGGPVATTQVVGASVMGVGAAWRLPAVRWQYAANLGYAWFLTVPVCATLSGGVFWALDRLLQG